jgi:hypothetical protein
MGVGQDARVGDTKTNVAATREETATGGARQEEMREVRRAGFQARLDQ